MSQIKAWLENLSEEMGHMGEINDEVLARGEEIAMSGIDIDD